MWLRLMVIFANFSTWWYLEQVSAPSSQGYAVGTSNQYERKATLNYTKEKFWAYVEHIFDGIV